MELTKDYFKWYCANDYCHIIPKEPGCYAIYLYDLYESEYKLYYIGTARNLYTRLKKHAVIMVLKALFDYPIAVVVKCKIIKNNKKRLNVEKKLIQRLKPRINYVS